MSTLVQQNNSPHYSQPITMNNNENGARQQRPTHNPSKNLLQNELQSLYDILGHNRVTLATAVAQILHGNNGAWRKQACGVFCFVKDYDDRNYFFRLYDLKSRQSIYQELVPATLRLEKVLDVFYTFDGLNCKIGVNFVDRDEAQTFSHHFHSKQEDRHSKKDKKKGTAPTKTAPPPVQPTTSSPAVSTLMNGIKPPPPNSATQTLQAATPATVNTPKKSNTRRASGFLTLGRKAKNIRPDISAPIQSTLVHVGHIGTKDSFFNDDTQKQLFEEVLANMHISAEDKLYVREIVNTDGGLEKLLAKPTPPVRDYPPPAPGPPEIPPRSGRAPHQDISVPPSAHHQSTNNRPQPFQDLFTPPTGSNQQPAPNVPPRPGPRVPENPYPSQQAPPTAPPPPPPPPFPGSFDSHRTHAPPAPPPPPPPPPTPMPSNFTHQTPSTGGPPPPPPMPPNFTHQTPSTGGPPPPPPPPPPGPGFSSGSGTNSLSMVAQNPGRDNLLDDIRKFGTTTTLKQAKERPALPQVTSAGDSSPGAQDTMAMNILKILAERREKLIGPEGDNDSDSSQDDWSS